uniref:Uncharacterized protein n=1 Tax=Brassica campestris TaxID=3711 RepID=M4EGE0_BRACM
MFSRRWDPGIGEEVWIGIGNHQDKIHGDTEKRFLSDLRRFEVIRGKWELGTLRKIRIIAKLISISVIIKTKLQDNKGITSDYSTTTTFFCLERIGRINGVWRIGIYCGIGVDKQGSDYGMENKATKVWHSGLQTEGRDND